MPEFVHQDCVKLIGNDGAHKHSCALKPLSILNTGSIKTFLPASVSTYVIFIFLHKYLLPDVIN